MYGKGVFADTELAETRRSRLNAFQRLQSCCFSFTANSASSPRNAYVHPPSQR